ncbi:MAG: phenylalanine--tRNA ligase subunit beta [Chloroflexi bacterium]|nr:phenylalanine--tRNA ligase subunit beta [Chloroflexota bacterium]
MRVPLSWLREYVDVDLSPEALADRLTLLGMEVRGIERIGADWSRVVVGELLTVDRHPNSARLSLTTVRVGDGEPTLSIVCGATNIAPGQRIPVALPGSVLPGDRRIEIAKLAGVESQGMLCSGDELGLSSDADGILILPADTPIGLPMEDLVGDVVLDVDVKPNRGDALSILGLAREVSAATGAPVRWPGIVVTESGDATADHVRVDVLDTERCPRFVARYLDGVSVGPSPFAVQQRLTAAGMRPISNIVDASNYVMLELGKPIHTFDADGVPNGHIIVRGAEPGERLTTLDHVERVLDPEVLLIAGDDGPLGLAGVMGGLDSEVSDTTSRVIVESALFDPVSIRRTAFRFALRSEASLRFEKGQEHRLARIGADRAAQLILAWGGGRAATEVVDTDPVELPRARVAFRPARVARLLGVDLPSTEQAALLARVEVTTEPADPTDLVPIAAAGPTGAAQQVPAAEGALVAVIPGHRRDLVIEADIAEEVARVRGYETLPGTLPTSAMPAIRPDPRRLVDHLRGWLSGQGLLEVVTHGLIGPEDHARLGLAADDPATIRALNPVTADHSELRRSLLPGLLTVLADAERQRRPDVAVFEVGPIHARVDGQPTETPMVGVLLAGSARPATWAATPRAWDLADGKGLVEALVARIADASVDWRATTPHAGVEHPGRTAEGVVTLPDGRAVVLGRVTEVHPALLAAMDIRAPHVISVGLEIGAIAAIEPGRVQAGRVDGPPPVERDLAVVVDATRGAGDVAAIIRDAAGPSLVGLGLFDRYQGAQLGADQVSLAWRLRLDPDPSAPETATDDLMDHIATVLSERIGARRRA